ncbi:hypothetical protein WN943_000781 [Citrus x changshan-huyou]
MLYPLALTFPSNSKTIRMSNYTTELMVIAILSRIILEGKKLSVFADKTEMDENASQSKAEKSPSFSFLVVKPINVTNFAGLNLGPSRNLPRCLLASID